MELDVPTLLYKHLFQVQAPGCPVFAIGEAGLLNVLYDAGITINDVNPDYAVVGEGRACSLETLTKSGNDRRGARKPELFRRRITISGRMTQQV